jgi:hypothetical protein
MTDGRTLVRCNRCHELHTLDRLAWLGVPLACWIAPDPNPFPKFKLWRLRG